MKMHKTPIKTNSAWPVGRTDPDQVLMDAIANSVSVTICKACEKEFDMDGLVYCMDCRQAPGLSYNNYDIEDL